MDMDNKMSSSAMSSKKIEMRMKEYIKDWKARSEIQSTWEKKHILLYKPSDSIYTSIMKFRYIEDYEKMKQLNKMLKEILKKMDEKNQPIGIYPKSHIDFVYELEDEADKLLKLIKECSFNNIDLFDGVVFINKFSYIHKFMYKNNIRLDYCFNKLLRSMGNNDDGIAIFEDMENLIVKLSKIYEELFSRGIKI